MLMLLSIAISCFSFNDFTLKPVKYTIEHIVIIKGLICVHSRSFAFFALDPSLYKYRILAV